MPCCDAVFEGGGIKGIGLAGREFFRIWDFEQYKAGFRQVAEKNRREMSLVAAASVRQEPTPGAHA